MATYQSMIDSLKSRLGLNKYETLLLPTSWPAPTDWEYESTGKTGFDDEAMQALLERARLLYTAWTGGASQSDVQLGMQLETAVFPKDGNTNSKE